MSSGWSCINRWSYNSSWNTKKWLHSHQWRAYRSFKHWWLDVRPFLFIWFPLIGKNTSTFFWLFFVSLNCRVNVLYAFDNDFVSAFDGLSDKSATDWMDTFMELVAAAYADTSLTGYIGTTVTIKGTATTYDGSLSKTSRWAFDMFLSFYIKFNPCGVQIA